MRFMDRWGKYRGIWFVLCMIQVIVLIFYVVFYTYDLMSLWSVLYRNNSLVGNNPWVSKVEWVDEQGDSTYNIRVSALSEVEIEVSTKDRICTVMEIEDELYQVEYAYGVFYQYNHPIGECSIYLTETGGYLIQTDDGSYELDTLDNINLVSKEGEGIKLRLDNATTFNVPSIGAYFTTKLSDDSLYFDEASGVFLQNVSKDFANTFLMNSNLVICMLSEIIFLAITLVLYKGGEVKFVRDKVLLMIFVVFFLILLLSAILPFILF